MILDAGRLPPGTVIRTEVCVIGAGAAGITASLELARRRHEVVLLEAGGLSQSRTSQHELSGDIVRSDLDGEQADEDSLHPQLDIVRQRRLGGTTGAWGGRCRPLDEIDFEARDYVPGSGWPLGRSDLEPYYRRAQEYCEVGEYEYTSQAAFPRSEKFLFQEGVGREVMDSKLFRYSRPTDFGKRYRALLRTSPYIRVLYHGTVLRLEVAIDGAKIHGAVVASSPGREFRVEARSFVLAGGGLETARLLLLSGAHAKAGIGTGHHLIGRNYMTHLDGFVGKLRFGEPAPRAAYTYELSRDAVYCRRVISVTEATQRMRGLLNFGCVLYPPAWENPSHGDGLLSAFAVAKQALYRTKLGFKSRRYGLRRNTPFPWGAHLRNIIQDPMGLPGFAAQWSRRRWLASRKLPSFLVQPRSGEYRILFSAEQSPSYSNVVGLADERDSYGLPRLRVRWGVADSDRLSILTTLSIIAEEVQRRGVGVAEVPMTVEELASSMGGFLGGTHAMGTTRMAASPTSGVVDRECRVHGIGNLYIASSAVFPTGGFAPPTLTIVALSIRICDVLDRSGP
jgi:choline dehydrogenase-like flavoprotein